MKPAGRVDIGEYAAMARALPVLAALQDGGETQACFVGGCVRDAMLETQPADIDVATVHRPDEVMARLRGAGMKVIPTGIAYGTVTVVFEGHSVEVTTLRRDVETFGRRAIVAFSVDWAEDAGRRDFTINTLLADRGGAVFDPLGQGLDDLRQGRVRFVGDPATRIAEDTLRILRFFRFHGRFGRDAADAAALAACSAAAPSIDRLSRERVTQEVLRILDMDHAAETLGLMFGAGVLTDLPSPIYRAEVLRNLIELQAVYASPSLTARLAVMAGPGGRHVETMTRWLLLSSRDRKVLDETIAAATAFDLQDAAAIRRLIATRGNKLVLDSVLLQAAWRNYSVAESNIALARDWRAPGFPLSGDDLLTLGVTPGPDIGAMLSAVRQWWMDGGFKADKAACLRHIASSFKV